MFWNHTRNIVSLASLHVSVGGSVLPSAASLEVPRNPLDTSEAQCWSDGVPGQLYRITTSYIAE